MYVGYTSIQVCGRICVQCMHVGVCLQAYKCVCVAIIESPHCGQASSQSHIPVVYVIFQGKPLSSSLPPNSSHLSFLLYFHFLSVLLLSPSHLPSSISYFPLR